jgi:hypothetical protein
MLKHLKRLFGIKPTEAKLELAPVQEVIVTPTPEVVAEPVVVMEVVLVPTPEVVAEPVTESVVEEAPVEIKKPTKKTKAKKAVK